MKFPEVLDASLVPAFGEGRAAVPPLRHAAGLSRHRGLCEMQVAESHLVAANCSHSRRAANGYGAICHGWPGPPIAC
jgi:hypothetical protein